MSNQGWQDGGMKTENMKTEVRSQESEWGRPREMLASSQRCRRPGPEGIRSTETREIPKAGGGGQKPGSFRTRTMGKRVDVGKGGQKVGKRTGFSRIGTALNRLFPHKSTQVVDFPHKATARLFWGRPEMVLATDETRVKHGWGANLKQGGTGQTEERVNREPHEIREPIYRATFAWLAY